MSWPGLDPAIPTPRSAAQPAALFLCPPFPYIPAMTFDDVRRLIEPEKEALRARGVAALYVFGSVARGEAGSASDVDVLIDIEPGKRFHILDLANVYNRLTSALGTEVDIVTSRSVKNALQERVLRDAVRVY
jgi:predicted nucleotidyltransferase